MMAECFIIKFWQTDMSRKEKKFLKDIWVWLRTVQNLTVEEADLAMMLSVDEYDALIESGAV